MHAAEKFSDFATEERPFRFVCLTGDFIDQTESGRSLYVNIKGRVERELAAMDRPAFRTIGLRAGAIIPTKEVSSPPHHQEGANRARACHRLAEIGDHLDGDREGRAESGERRERLGDENERGVDRE